MRINFTEEELFRIRARFQKMFVYRNVLSVIFSPQYFFRSVSMACRYPMGFILGIKRFLRSRAIDAWLQCRGSSRNFSAISARSSGCSGSTCRIA